MYNIQFFILTFIVVTIAVFILLCIARSIKIGPLIFSSALTFAVLSTMDIIPHHIEYIKVAFFFIIPMLIYGILFSIIECVSLIYKHELTLLRIKYTFRKVIVSKRTTIFIASTVIFVAFQYFYAKLCLETGNKSNDRLVYELNEGILGKRGDRYLWYDLDYAQNAYTNLLNRVPEEKYLIEQLDKSIKSNNSELRTLLLARLYLTLYPKEYTDFIYNMYTATTNTYNNILTYCVCETSLNGMDFYLNGNLGQPPWSYYSLQLCTNLLNNCGDYPLSENVYPGVVKTFESPVFLQDVIECITNKMNK